MSHNHAVVWLDKLKAHVLQFNAETVEAEMLKAHPAHPHVVQAKENTRFYDDIATALQGSLEVLVTGPGQEKLLFRKHLDQHYPQLASCVVGVETVDHPSDGQLLAYARKYFHKVDLMR